MEYREASTPFTDSISHSFNLKNSSMKFYNTLIKKTSPLSRKVMKNFDKTINIGQLSKKIKSLLEINACYMQNITSTTVTRNVMT